MLEALDTTEYAVTAAHPIRDADEILRLWLEGGLGSVESTETARYRWYYLSNPAGVSFCNFLQYGDEGRPIGFVGVGRRTLFVDGEPRIGGIFVDFVVMPKHRKLFPATALLRQAGRAALSSLHVLYGIPNSKADAISRRIEYSNRVMVPRFVRVVRSDFYLQRKISTWLSAPLGLVIDLFDRALTRSRVASHLSAGWVDKFDSRFDDLWKLWNKRGVIAGIRDREFLNWRFQEQPGRDYKIFVVTGKKDSALRTYFVCERWGSMLTIKDCLNVGSERELTTGLLLLCRAARELGVSAVEMPLLADTGFYKALRRAFFVRRSWRQFYTGYADSMLDEVHRQNWRWYVTQADEDV